MYQRDFFVCCFQYDQISIQINTLVQFSHAWKIHSFRNNVSAKLTKHFIFIVQDTVILCCLIFDDQFFDADIFFHRMVSVQMVFRNIQDCTYLRRKLFDRFQLETADLGHCCGAIFHFQCLWCIWSSNISYYKNRIFCITHNLSQKSCCSCFAICSCNCQYSSLAGTIRKFYLTPYRKSLFIKALYKRNIRRYTRTQHYQIQSLLHFFRKFSCIYFNIVAIWNFFYYSLFIKIFISIINDRLRPYFRQKLCCTDSTFSGTKYKHFFPL